MVSRRPPNPVRKGRPAQIPALHSPLEKTPHKAANGELSISCRNRHCPKCQTAARERWIAARRRELLPTRYAHVVFTLAQPLGATGPAEQEGPLRSPVSHQCGNPSRSRSRSPDTSVRRSASSACLHSWSQKLNLHPHVHCVVPAGGLSPDHTRWVRSRDNYFLPEKGAAAKSFAASSSTRSSKPSRTASSTSRET